VRNRLILELMARGGMRIGEVLQLTSKDVSGHKLAIRSPKSGKDAEVVFIPRKVADRLRAYMKDTAVEPEPRIFPITYAAALRTCTDDRDSWGGSTGKALPLPRNSYGQ
jgi:integrase